MINELISNITDSEYQDTECHKVIDKERSESGNGAVKDTAIHINVVYKKKNVKVRLSFADGPSDKNTKLFYDSLKKIYMKKAEYGTGNSGVSALK